MKTAAMILLALGAAIVPSAQAQAPAPAPAPKPVTSTATRPPAPAAQKTFASPEAALKALVDAAQSHNLTELAAILGADGLDLVSTADSVRDNAQADAFAAKVHEKTRVVRSSKNPTVATFEIGNDAWPAPIPVVEKNGTWRFDTAKGRQEILFRRIGENELDAITVCHGFVEAQQDYALTKHDGALVNQYAQKIIATPGKHDGLAWQNSDGTWGGPVGEAVARVIEEGYTSKAQPFHGYYFKVLKGQGPAAKLGQLDYLVNGAMIGGFALAAAPAEYEVTGIKSFIVSQDGIVYEKDLGPKSLDVFHATDRYNPDKSWSRVKE